MNWYKTSQSDQNYRKVRRCLEVIFNSLEQSFGKTAKWDSHYRLSVSIEKMDEADIRGTSWIQVWHSKDYVDFFEMTSTLGIERYYESESMQMEYGKSEKLKFDISNPQKAITDLTTIIGRMSK